ncbi:hypothetical protein ATO12_16050 [Aquimarina atlantica]|uniref:Uncharacterized protein n=1 Tax=Aquimarina atlantica TaxID=1317122 RepID=A0A023BTW2_9FLAO|nr:hypothetical protein [Aquimarina atlantica]EZH73452.1 hypothetical protein ATO12_16050 [Aquimarina atlantica]
MEDLEIVKKSKFYTELNALLREQLTKIKQNIDPVYEQILEEKQFDHPLPIICQFEYASWGGNKQWRLELDFDEYQWSNETVKPHFLNALVYLSISKESIGFKYQLCSSFNNILQPSEIEKIELKLLNDTDFVSKKIKEVERFLDDLPQYFIQEIEKINFDELEYMLHPKIQEKWKQGYLPGFDCIVMGEGDFVIGNVYSTYDPNTGETKQYWSPLCDTTLERIEKYDDDIWTEVSIFHGAFEYENQKIVFGDGAMGNEGYVASTTLTGELNWAIFFTFSNPIHKAEIIDKHLICYGDTGTVIDIDLNNITKIKITLQNT